ncbi:MAG: hypothetical protein V4795_00400 [Pseudomonadota bacterium]
MRNLGGWTRLWIAASGLWIVVTGLYAINFYPRGTYAPHSDDFLQSLPLELQALLAPAEELDFGNIVEMPNSHRIRFKSASSENLTSAAAAAYAEASRKAQTQIVKDYFIGRSMVIMSVPLTLLMLGLLFSWVRNGFQGKREA